MTVDNLDSTTVGNNSRVTLYFSLSLEDGSTIDSNFDNSPATFTVGDGNLLPGFEQRVIGLQRGVKSRFVIPPEEAFGNYQTANRQIVSRRRFSADIDPVVGLVTAFNDAGGGNINGVITALTDDTVTVDFNHPLAGKKIVFDVLVVAVEAEVGVVQEAHI